jgi:hypothetical protein
MLRNILATLANGLSRIQSVSHFWDHQGNKQQDTEGNAYALFVVRYKKELLQACSADNIPLCSLAVALKMSVSECTNNPILHYGRETDNCSAYQEIARLS